jgi:type IV pilus assembly protein PilO
MKLHLPHGSWLLTIPLAALGLGYVYFFYLPARKAMAEIRDEVKAKQEYIDKAQMVPAQLLSVQTELDKAKSYTAACDKAGLAGAELPTLFGRIAEVAKRSGAATTRFTPESAVKHDKIKRVPLTVALTGTFPQVEEFIRGLESLPARIWIGSLKMDASEKSGRSVKLEISLDVFANNSEDSD